MLDDEDSFEDDATGFERKLQGLYDNVPKYFNYLMMFIFFVAVLKVVCCSPA